VTGTSDDTFWRARFRKREDIVSREIAGETILVPIRGKLVDMQRLFSLNGVAAHIWQELDGNKSLAGIRDGVLEAFDVDKEQAEADIREFVGELIGAELIVEATWGL
jgi:hypothetical protein